MTAVKGNSSVYGVTQSVVDAAGNQVVVANGPPLVVGNDPERMTSSATAIIMFAGTFIRVTVAQAANFDPPAVATSPMDADGELVRFVAGAPLYTGGQFEGANASGLRMLAKGTFCDLTAANVVDIGTVMTAFVSAGVVA